MGCLLNVCVCSNCVNENMNAHLLVCKYEIEQTPVSVYMYQ